MCPSWIANIPRTRYAITLAASGAPLLRSGVLMEDRQGSRAAILAGGQHGTFLEPVTLVVRSCS